MLKQVFLQIHIPVIVNLTHVKVSYRKLPPPPFCCLFLSSHFCLAEPSTHWPKIVTFFSKISNCCQLNSGSVLGLARTGLIFTELHLAKQSRVFHTMCRHAGFRWGGAGGREHSRGSGGHSCGSVRESGSVLRVCFVYSPFFCIIVVPDLFV